MIREFPMKILPIAMTTLVLVAACEKAPLAKDDIVVEDDIVLDDGSVIREWMVEEVEPIPANKPASVAGTRPSVNHIWVAGEWKREGDQWVWEAGHWSEPPTMNSSWMAGHWRLDAGKWHWMPGHWIATSKPYYVTEPFVVPEPLPELKPAKPSSHDHWIAGHWNWDGDWYWSPGYWTTKPDPNAEWVPGHWDDFGTDGGYRWIGGHWRVRD